MSEKPYMYEAELVILSPKRVRAMTGLSEATIWRMRKMGEFPRAVRLSPRRVGWKRSDVLKWIEERIES